MYTSLSIKIKESISEWLKIVETDNLKYKMSSSAYDKSLLDSISLAYDLFQMLGIKLSKNQEEKAKDILDSYQLMDNGFFAEKDYKSRLNQDENDSNRIIEMHSNYITFQAIGAYKAINRLPNKKISFYDQFIKNNGIKHYLSTNCPWDRSPWGAGGMVDNLGTILDCNIKMGHKEYVPVLSDIFEWLEENQCKKSGLWGDVKVQGINGLINGGYHLMRGTYFLQQKKFNFHKQIIDIILKDLNEHQLFSTVEAHGCQDLDHFYLLNMCTKQDSEYRKGEIRNIAKKRLNEILKLSYCEDGGFSFEARNSVIRHNYYDVTPGFKESDMQGCVFYLQTIISIFEILGFKHSFNYSITHG